MNKTPLAMKASPLKNVKASPALDRTVPIDGGSAVDAEVASADGPPDARLCSDLGNAEVNWDSVCVDVPAGVRAAWATAAAWPVCPAGFVVCGGEVKGFIVAAVAELAAYPYMVAASWAHISAYWASLAMMAGVFCPKTLVATKLASWARLAAITGGGTVAANAAS